MRKHFVVYLGAFLSSGILAGCQATEPASLQPVAGGSLVQGSVSENSSQRVESRLGTTVAIADARKIGPGATEPGTRITVSPPNLNDWDSVRTETRAWRFTCKPFRCADQTAVYVTAETNTNGRLGRAQLEKYMRETIPKEIRDQNIRSLSASNGQVSFELLNSRISEIKGFPAIVIEVRKRSGASSDSIIRSYIFTTYALIRVDSISSQAQVARNYSTAVISGFDIMDLPAQGAIIVGPHLVVLDGSAAAMSIFSAEAIPPADRNVSPQVSLRGGRPSGPYIPSDPTSRR
jgi:hypothetical protein